MKNKKIVEPQKLVVLGSTIWLYGTIGQISDDVEAHASENRDIDFVLQLESLAKLYPSVDVRINSSGGSMRHGSAMIAAIKRHGDKIHTYNDGICASMAADIWMSAPKANRHIAKNATVMIHAPSGGQWGTAKDMREYADMLDQMAQGTIDLMAEATGKTAEEIKAQFYDYADHTLTATQCMELGLVEKADEYESENPNGDNIDIQKYFDMAKENMVAKLEATIKQQIQSQVKIDNDMSFEDIVKSVNDGTATPEQIATLKTAVTEAEKKAAATQPLTLADIEKVKADLKAEYEAKLQEEITKLGKTTPSPEPQKRGGEDIDPLNPPVISEAEKAMNLVNEAIKEGKSF